MNDKLKLIKFLIVIILLLSTIALSFSLPKGTKYVGLNFISKLEIPTTMTEWHGVDVSSKINIDLGADVYGFVSEFLAYQYVKKDGKRLLFILLDAGNFHYPNKCLILSGYEVRDLDKTELHASGRTFKAHTLYAEKTRETAKYLILYWIVIDKRPVPNWVEQKVKQLYFSLFNKKRVGLMVRLDIPVRENNIKNSLILAKQFVSDLSQKLPPEHTDYVFGEIK